MLKDTKKIITWIKFGVNNDNHLIRLYSYLVVLWILFLSLIIITDFIPNDIKDGESLIVLFFVTIIFYLIFAYPLLLPLWYLKSKRPTSAKPVKGLGEPVPPKKVETAPEPTAPAPKSEEKKVESISQESPIQKAPREGSKTLKNCPSCGGKISELNFFKLKAGSDVVCEFCSDVIESQGH